MHTHITTQMDTSQQSSLARQRELKVLLSKFEEQLERDEFITINNPIRLRELITNLEDLQRTCTSDLPEFLPQIQSALTRAHRHLTHIAEKQAAHFAGRANMVCFIKKLLLFLLKEKLFIIKYKYIYTISILFFICIYYIFFLYSLSHLYLFLL